AELPVPSLGEQLGKGWDGQPALASDWTDHLSTLFPEVRIKSVLEVRSADSGPLVTAGALAALWRGLLYDARALDDAGRLLPRLPFAEHLAFHAEAQRNGLRGAVRGIAIGELARGMVAVAREGLQRLDPLDVPLLEPLEEIVRSGRSPADVLLAAFAKDPSPASVFAVTAL
ncbi:MAG TPA: glutamate-cysteine ligase family protein, partial [Myxococcaceae bacterium]|nr:glutamate-cysteine ligase family protein [Myxococcaceae bacterium]